MEDLAADSTRKLSRMKSGRALDIAAETVRICAIGGKVLARTLLRPCCNLPHPNRLRLCNSSPKPANASPRPPRRRRRPPSWPTICARASWEMRQSRPYSCRAAPSPRSMSARSRSVERCSGSWWWSLPAGAKPRSAPPTASEETWARPRPTCWRQRLRRRAQSRSRKFAKPSTGSPRRARPRPSRRP